MSLTSYINNSKEIRQFLLSFIKKKPKLFVYSGNDYTEQMINYSNKKEPFDDSSLLGTAFDYLFRMEIRRVYPHKFKSERWIADISLTMIPNIFIYATDSEVFEIEFQYKPRWLAYYGGNLDLFKHVDPKFTYELSEIIFSRKEIDDYQEPEHENEFSMDIPRFNRPIMFIDLKKQYRRRLKNKYRNKITLHHKTITNDNFDEISAFVKENKEKFSIDFYNNLIQYMELYNAALNTINKTREAVHNYYKSANEESLYNLANMCLRLAQLDKIVREFSGEFFSKFSILRIDKNEVKYIDLNKVKIPIDPSKRMTSNGGDENINNLIDLFKLGKNFIQTKFFKDSNIIYLNPGFSSRVLGGSDADIITENSIIELKTASKLTLEDNYIAQVIGYYFLLRRDDRFKEIWDKIENLVIFLARFNAFYVIPIKDLKIKKKDILNFEDNISRIIIESKLFSNEMDLKYNDISKIGYKIINRSLKEDLNIELDAINGIGPGQKLKLINGGIRSVKDLCSKDATDLVKLGFRKEVAEDLIGKAKSYINREAIIFVDDSKILEFDDDIYLDIETTGLYKDPQIWCIGMYLKRSNKFLQLTAEELDDEEKILKKFAEIIKKEKGNIIYFAGNHFDERVLKRRFSYHGIDIPELKIIDFKTVLRKITIRIPFKNYGLKELAYLFGYSYKYPNLSGKEIPWLYQHYSRMRERDFLTDSKEKILKKLLLYNKDDVISLKFIVEKFKEISTKNGGLLNLKFT